MPKAIFAPEPETFTMWSRGSVKSSLGDAPPRSGTNDFSIGAMTIFVLGVGACSALSFSCGAGQRIATVGQAGLRRIGRAFSSVVAGVLARGVHHDLGMYEPAVARQLTPPSTQASSVEAAPSRFY